MLITMLSYYVSDTFNTLYAIVKDHPSLPDISIINYSGEIPEQIMDVLTRAGRFPSKSLIHWRPGLFSATICDPLEILSAKDQTCLIEWVKSWSVREVDDLTKNRLEE